MRNLQLFEQVKSRILAEPLQFYMDAFYQDEIRDNDVIRVIPNCGTACCIAGWAVAIHNGQKPSELLNKARAAGPDELLGMADELLGITPIEADSLFYTWPEEFEERFLDARGNPAEQAKIAVERIDHFLATGL